MAEISIQLNGESLRIPSQCNTVLDLLKHFSIKPDNRIVELNSEIISESNFAKTALKPNSVVEVIQFMGGGS